MIHLFKWSITLLSFALLFYLAGCSVDDPYTPETPDTPEIPGGTTVEIHSFSFQKSNNPKLVGDVNFTVDQSSKTITGYIDTWIDSTDPDQFKANFTTTTGATVYVGNQVQVSGTTINTFEEGQLKYTVKLSEDVKSEYTVIVLCPQIMTELPVMRFSVNLSAITSKEVYNKTKLEIIDNGIGGDTWSYDKADVEIRLRGNSTMGLPKKPFRIKFPDKVSPLGLTHAKEKSWVLLANDADKSLLRNAVAFTISRTLLKTGDPFHNNKAVLFTAATQHVHVYVGDKYQGLYHLTDQIQRTSASDYTSGTGRVNLQNPGTSGNGLTGGYLVELDGFAYSEFTYFKTPKGLPITLKYPELDEEYTDQDLAFADTRFVYIKDCFATAENSIFAANYANLIDGWRKYFDQSTLVDYYIISEFTGNPDSWWSTYMYKLRDTDSEKLFFGPVWDFDIAFNNDKRLGDAVDKLMLTNAHDPKIWMTQFFKDVSLKSAVKARWNSKKVELRTNALASVSDAAAVMSMSVEANFKRWNIGSQALGHAAQCNYTKHQEALDDLKAYINDRYNYLDGIFNGW